MTIKKLFDLRGKNALVTGSSQGIGKAIALALAEYGANVLVHCRNEKEMAGRVAAQIREFGVRSGIITCDLAADKAAETLFKECQEQMGNIDILVINASLQIKKPWTDVQPEEFDVQVKVNWRSSFELIQQFVPGMSRNRWGRILTIGSVQQEKPHPQMITYAATKSAMVNMVKNLAIQLAKDGITINNLAPGVIVTGRNEEALADENYRKAVQAKVPAGFFGEPEDCAGLALLLCSDAGRYITGADIFIDGGMSL
jgi:glucose 1-dehydrogenase